MLLLLTFFFVLHGRFQIENTKRKATHDGNRTSLVGWLGHKAVENEGNVEHNVRFCSCWLGKIAVENGISIATAAAAVEQAFYYETQSGVNENGLNVVVPAANPGFMRTVDELRVAAQHYALKIQTRAEAYSRAEALEEAWA